MALDFPQFKLHTSFGIMFIIWWILIFHIVFMVNILHIVLMVNIFHIVFMVNILFYISHIFHIHTCTYIAINILIASTSLRDWLKAEFHHLNRTSTYLCLVLYFLFQSGIILIGAWHGFFNIIINTVEIC